MAGRLHYLWSFVFFSSITGISSNKKRSIYPQFQFGDTNCDSTEKNRISRCVRRPQAFFTTDCWVGQRAGASFLRQKTSQHVCDAQLCKCGQAVIAVRTGTLNSMTFVHMNFLPQCCINEGCLFALNLYLMQFHFAFFTYADEITITFLMQKLFLLNHIKMFHGSHQKVLIYGNCSFLKTVLKIQMVCFEFLFSTPPPLQYLWRIRGNK